jgi:hypothetical protein
MTVTIAPAQGSLGVVIRCPGCPHHPAEDAPDEWHDVGGLFPVAMPDVYFAGSSVEALRAFLARHEGDQP